MIEAIFSPLVPTDASKSFYTKFYNQFCFIQVNDTFIKLLKEHLTEEEKEDLLRALNNSHEDIDMAVIYSLGAGIMNESLMRKRKENRGISIELFNCLESENIDPLDWHIKAIEFLMVYAICEQAVKEYLVSKGKNSSEIKEDKLLHILFSELENSNLKNSFIKGLRNGSSSVITSQNELIAVWRYYTLFRHTLAHAGGRITERMKNKMNEVIKKNSKELKSINSAMFIESSEDIFSESPFEGTVISISDKCLNFFRNMAILIVESLECAINPNEYGISDFDPYKL